MTSRHLVDELIAGTPFERTADPVFLMDPEQRHVLAANDAGCRLLGYTRDELRELPVACIHPSEERELDELLQAVVRDGRASTITLTCRAKDGTFLPTEISLHALDVDGRRLIMGLVQDRSDHRHVAPR